MGDFNDRCITWDSAHENSELDLVNLINTYCLYQMVSSPTRITQSSSSLLDLLITNKPTWVNKVKILPPVASCDHSPVIAEINFTIPGNIYLLQAQGMAL